MNKISTECCLPSVTCVTIELAKFLRNLHNICLIQVDVFWLSVSNIFNIKLNIAPFIIIRTRVSFFISISIVSSTDVIRVFYRLNLTSNLHTSWFSFAPLLKLRICLPYSKLLSISIKLPWLTEEICNWYSYKFYQQNWIYFYDSSVAAIIVYTRARLTHPLVVFYGQVFLGS